MNYEIRLTLNEDNMWEISSTLDGKSNTFQKTFGLLSEAAMCAMFCFPDQDQVGKPPSLLMSILPNLRGDK